MKESPVSPEKEKLRHQIGVYTEAVLTHAIALSHGKTHKEAADAIMELVESYTQKKYQEGELNGRIEENRTWQRILYNRDLSKPTYVTFADLTEREKYLESQLERKEQ